MRGRSRTQEKDGRDTGPEFGLLRILQKANPKV